MMLEKLAKDFKSIIIYGEVEHPLPKKLELDSLDRSLPTNLVSVVGARVDGHCIKFPRPFLIALSGDGEKATDCDMGENIRQWEIHKKSQVLALLPGVGEASDLLDGVSQFADIGGCITATVEDGKVCVDLPIVGKQCISLPVPIPSGTSVQVCLDACTKFFIPCGVKATVKFNGQSIVTKKFGCC